MVKVNNVQHSIDTPEREALFNKRRAFGVEQRYQNNRRQWEDNPKKFLVETAPLHVDIELSSVCNLNCPMCYTITDHFKSKVKAGFMNFDLYKKIVDECAKAGVFSIRLSLRGESTLHKHFLEAIRYAKAHGIDEVSTLTSGRTFIDPGFCKEVVDAGLDWITFSVDGTYDEYEKIRKPITYPQIKQALSNLKNARESQGKQKPAIKVQGVWPAVRPDPERYLEEMTPLCDLIYVNPLVDYLQNDRDIEYEPGFCCYQPFQRLVIFSNGLAAPCANDQMGEHIVGDAAQESIVDIWSGEKMNRFRKAHREKKAVGLFGICQKCQVPRKRTSEQVTINGSLFAIDNYSNRKQNIGQ